MTESGDLIEDSPDENTLVDNLELKKNKSDPDGVNESDEDRLLIVEDTPENRFKEFVVQCCRIFVRTSQLLVAYAKSEEAVPVDDLALQKVAETILSTTLKQFVPFAGEIVKIATSFSDSLRGKIQQKRGHEAAKRVYKVIAEVIPEKDWLKVMVPVFADIFLAYNVQFIHVLNEDTLKESEHWMIAMYKLASDTVFRIFHGMREASTTCMTAHTSENQLLFVRKEMIKAFLAGRSSGGWKKKQKIKIFGGTLGHRLFKGKINVTLGRTLFKDSSGKSVTTQMFFEYPKVKCNNFVYGPVKVTTPSFPCRHAFEGEVVMEEKQDYNEPQTWEGKEVNDEYDILSKKEDLKSDVFKELEKLGYRPFTSHDMAALHKSLLATITKLQTAVSQNQGLYEF